MSLHERLANVQSSASLIIIGLLALCIPSIVAPLNNPLWHGCRTAAFEVGAVLVLAMAAVQSWARQRQKQWSKACQTPPVRIFLVLLLWGCLSAALSPAKSFAVQGVLLLVGGSVITITVAAEARSRPQYEFVLNALTGATLVISLTGFALFGANKMPLAVGLYNDHMLYGAVFTVLLPIMLAISLSPAPVGRRLSGQAALLCGLAALGLSETRSAWIGFAVSLLIFAGLTLFVRTRRPLKRGSGVEGRGQKIQSLVTGILVLGVTIYLAAALLQTGQIGERLRTFSTTVPQGKETSVAWRFAAWAGGAKMLRQKPWTGWGIGGYPRWQYQFTGVGQSAEIVQSQGPRITDEAHNSYLQTGVEMGLPGLLLWLGVLGSAFALGVTSLRRLSSGSPSQWALIGCLSALVGQSVDAFANPGWQFGEVSLFLWIALGLTIALALGQPKKADFGVHERALIKSTSIAKFGRIAVALTVMVALLWAIYRTMMVLPAPKL